jgi:hypothetical protein
MKQLTNGGIIEQVRGVCLAPRREETIRVLGQEIPLYIQAAQLSLQRAQFILEAGDLLLQYLHLFTGICLVGYFLSDGNLLKIDKGALFLKTSGRI